jgi:hypothetical protein
MKRGVYFLFGLLLLDTGYSFVQHAGVALDGDLARIIVPSEEYGKVLSDPFGLRVLFQDEVYPGTNRFFTHWLIARYFQKAPALLQRVADPIDSVYLSCALAKTGIQLLLIYLLAVYVSGKGNPLSRELVAAAFLIAPLFQTFGFNRSMGIIDISVTYVFFYALPLGLLLVFFLPFFQKAYLGKNAIRSRFLFFGLMLLSIILAFSGPLVPGIVLIICPVAVLSPWFSHFKNCPGLPLRKRAWTSVKHIPRPLSVLFVFLSVLCLYSLYIGMNNSENLWQTVPIWERYSRIPKGVLLLLTQHWGLPLLILTVFLNLYWIGKRHAAEEGKRIVRQSKWIGLFALVYIVLLPLGGFRTYRPNIIRYDTIMPITLGVMYIFALSTYFLIKSLSSETRKWYSAGIAALLLFFTVADKPEFGNNACEKNALRKMAGSTEKVVWLEEGCRVLSWKKIIDPGDSALNARLIHYWGITKDNLLYYQK